ncbi:MAG: hypothetical protein H0W14_12750, partial [Actinobacteria bacterium]|nr:hypothetical protein [Actinomycetota bacterium]
MTEGGDTFSLAQGYGKPGFSCCCSSTRRTFSISEPRWRDAIVKKLLVALVIATLTVSVSVTGAVAKPGKKSAEADICVLLPDPKSSVRWETQDRPALVAAFKKAGVSYVINNANGDAQRQKTQADQCLSNDAKVVILTSLDAGSSLAIERAAKDA